MSRCPRAPSSVRSCGAPVAIEPASERRLVTVVFIDLVGSTKLASHLDPERFREGCRSHRQNGGFATDRTRAAALFTLGRGIFRSTDQCCRLRRPGNAGGNDTPVAKAQSTTKAGPAALRARPSNVDRDYMIPMTCPSGSANRAIVVSGATSVSGIRIRPPAASAFASVAFGSSVWT